MLIDFPLALVKKLLQLWLLQKNILYHKVLQYLMLSHNCTL